MNELLGKKIGMTQIFDDIGKLIPVTVLEVGPCVVVQVKTPEKDGYSAAQLGFDVKKKETKPLRNVYERLNSAPRRYVREVSLVDNEDIEAGKEYGLDLFENTEKVSVTGISKGKGFSGVMKRWGFRGKEATHGAHCNHRAPGSIGQCVDPGRVWKGKKMAGRHGNARITVKGLSVVSIDKDRNLMIVKGSVPGYSGQYVKVASLTEVN